MKRGFASDNNAGIHPEILRAIEQANQGHAVAYGNDPFTDKAVSRLKEIFGGNTDVYFVFIGTAANVLGLDAITKPYHSILCAQTSHIHEDECGAPERWTGCKVIALPVSDGKLTIADIEKEMYGIDFEHHSQPRVVSVTQTTEVGTVYTPDELRTLADFAHANNMLLHMDGARISNAAAWLGTGFAEITAKAGVDVLSFGGTKNGMMYGEAVVFFNKDHSEDFKYLRKQGMQLASKMRFIAVQFERFLKDDLWLDLATHSNKMARMLESEVKKIPEVRITQKVQSNMIFATIPREITPALQDEFFFYVRNEKINEVRWMCSYDTTVEDIEGFVSALKRLLGR
ncbi:MAG: low specificity L-threonine aldolase [Bacteroidales bacterium]|nr:low specificity L-threonine aldolase [Bacteroidales bacterium]